MECPNLSRLGFLEKLDLDIVIVVIILEEVLTFLFLNFFIIICYKCINPTLISSLGHIQKIIIFGIYTCCQ